MTRLSSPLSGEGGCRECGSRKCGFGVGTGSRVPVLGFEEKHVELLDPF